MILEVETGPFGPASREKYMIATTLKATAAIGIIAFAASQWAYSEADRIALERLTTEAAGQFSPATTGSVARAAQSSRIDPCNVPSR